jgi:hypothetical protein
VNAVADEDVINIPPGTYTRKLVGSLEDTAATGDRGCDRESCTTPATADDVRRIAQAGDRQWRYRMRSSPVAAGILWVAIALYLVSRFVLSC